MTDATALIADDDASIVWVLEKLLTEKGIAVIKAVDGDTACAELKRGEAQLAFLDINMPGRDGLSVLKEAGKTSGNTAIIIMTAESTMKNALEAMKLGAFDYITKPFDIAEVEIAIDKALENAALKRAVGTLTKRLRETLTGDAEFIGKSRAVQSVYKTIGKVSATDVSALILGETGTGKELVARLIHANSLRSPGPFIAVNSAAVPKDLMESELFGFEKGAFTGAVEEKKGKIELAHEGTLFLDEIGDMPFELQSKLLRAIQEKEFYRIGGKTPVRVDIRIIAATNADIEKAVAEKQFRQDLYFRLNGITLTLPPLRERKSDIPLLTEHYLDKFHSEFGGAPRSLSDKALEAMTSYAWPGNVRELENVLRRAMLLSPSLVLSMEDINLPVTRSSTESIEDVIAARLKPFIGRTEHGTKQELYGFIMQFMERPLIKLVLEKTKGNQVQAAETLGINRNTLRKKIKELKIKVDGIKDKDVR
ncbi:MAG: sigma-54-dependent Fis family transcriptional regulator [Deltaproteobacteria bacterium]|nr:sigma-54-dependent Fis family transcriptional regulator [Deltaproteobacteria bacterium]